MSNDSGEPKIIVDEDWKARVEREREQLRQQETQQRSAQREDVLEQGEPFIPPPPASFAVLVEWLAAQALTQLALSVPQKDTSGSADQRGHKQRLEQARQLASHFIDLLGVLEEKTQGNRSPEESRLLAQRLHELRLAYVEVLHTRSAEGTL